MEIEQTKYFRDLRRSLLDRFDESEIQVLVFDLGIEWGELSGENTPVKCASLIRYLARRGRLGELITLVREERPQFDWSDVPPSTQQVQDEKELTLSGVTNLQNYITKLTSLAKQYELNELKDEVRHSLELQTKVLVAGLNTDEKVIFLKFLTSMEMSIEYGHINFGGANLRGVDLSGTNLSRAGLYSADLTNANLTNANMHGADLTNAVLNRAILRGADLSNANLHNANLHRADLTDANLCGANLRTASDMPIHQTTLIESGVKYDGTTIWPYSFFGDRL